MMEHTEQQTALIKSLVINPNHDIRRITARLLKQLGSTVVEMPTHQIAYSMLSVMNPFDVIFVEIDIPVEEALEFLKNVKTRHPYATIIATSSLDEPGLTSKALTHGAIHCIFERHNRAAYQTALDVVSRLR